MTLNTDHFSQCIKTLEASLDHLNTVTPDSIEHDVFRNAAIKGLELSLETSGKLLRKVLKNYSANPREIDELTYKEVLRHAAKHGLLDAKAVKRWFAYRDNRNNTAHDYGKAFAELTLKLLPQFLIDVASLQQTLQKKLGVENA